MSHPYPPNLRTPQTQTFRQLESLKLAYHSKPTRATTAALLIALEDEARSECVKDSEDAWGVLGEYEDVMREYCRGDDDDVGLKKGGGWLEGMGLMEVGEEVGVEGVGVEKEGEGLDGKWMKDLLGRVVEIGFLPMGGGGDLGKKKEGVGEGKGMVGNGGMDGSGGGVKNDAYIERKNGNGIGMVKKQEDEDDYREMLKKPPLKKRRVDEDEYDSQDSFIDDRPVPSESLPDQQVQVKEPKRMVGSFRTARQSLKASRNKQQGRGKRPGTGMDGPTRKLSRAVLGTKRRFNPPKRKDEKAEKQNKDEEEKDLPEVPNVEPKLVEMILNEVLDKSPGVEWDDIAGLEFAKKNIMEAVVWPMLRPDIFTGLRGPPKGLLLFGPPGTGKTMIGRAIASRSGSTFYNISASSLGSKWTGESEKMVRALFGVARLNQPAVIFIDEIDSLLTKRTDGDHEASRRIKTEFLVQMDGAATSKNDRVLVVGATNTPQELDNAVLRRCSKRLYIPLPDEEARKSLVCKLMAKQSNSLTPQDFQSIAKASKGYSGSDMYALCSEAALGPVRDLGSSIQSISVDAVRPINLSDFQHSMRMVRASVSPKDLTAYQEWNKIYGSFPQQDTS